ncbi:hypothetical protein B0H17DRAFT_1144479 [Mycena rosella]|uniref:Uncharacterized protein n=1 Tax=Mycena rosella TaxID=1033263 RepID=A0AAD7CSU6_MYCRO|nr:hypothetical protein B0H17DRAFT_1144479 [Mycena rosella]
MAERPGLLGRREWSGNSGALIGGVRGVQAADRGDRGSFEGLACPHDRLVVRGRWAGEKGAGTGQEVGALIGGMHSVQAADRGSQGVIRGGRTPLTIARWCTVGGQVKRGWERGGNGGGSNWGVCGMQAADRGDQGVIRGVEFPSQFPVIRTIEAKEGGDEVPRVFKSDCAAPGHAGLPERRKEARKAAVFRSPRPPCEGPQEGEKRGSERRTS